MSRIVSHENCQHASTKAARAQCRRHRAKFADVFSAVLGETAGTAIEAPAPVFEGVAVTAENWREFREQKVVLFTRIDEDEEAPIAEGVFITGWGKQWVNYASPIGKVKRTAVTCLGARTVEDHS
jgi:hypothetical protein